MPLDGDPGQGPDQWFGPLLRQKGFRARGDRRHRRLHVSAGPDEASPTRPAGHGIRVHLQPDRMTALGRTISANALSYTGERPPARFNLARYCLARAAE